MGHCCHFCCCFLTEIRFNNKSKNCCSSVALKGSISVKIYRKKNVKNGFLLIKTLIDYILTIYFSQNLVFNIKIANKKKHDANFKKPKKNLKTAGKKKKKKKS